MKKYLKKIEFIIFILILLPIALIIALVSSIFIVFYFNAMTENNSTNNKFTKLFNPEYNSKIKIIYTKNSLTGNCFYGYNYNEKNYIYIAELSQYSKVDIKEINVYNQSLDVWKYAFYKILIDEHPLLMIHNTSFNQFHKINIYNQDNNNKIVKNNNFFYVKFYKDKFSLSNNGRYYESLIQSVVDIKSIEVLFIKVKKKTILIINYRIDKKEFEDDQNDISLLDLININE